MVILNKNADIAQLKTKIKKFSVVPLSFAELLSRPELLEREFGWHISAHPTEPRFIVVVDGKSIDVDGECGYILVGLYKPDIDIAWGSTEEELKIFADMHALKLTNS